MTLKKIKRKIYKFFHPIQGTILMLHRVVEQRSALIANRNLEVTPEFLENTIQHYQSKGYLFLNLDDVEAQLKKNSFFSKKFVCFTLDDGYRDNFEIAYPIFKKYNCPFTIYVATDFPDHKALIWWYILEDIILQHDFLRLSDGSELICKTFDDKNAAFGILHGKISAIEPTLLKETFDDWFTDYLYSFEDKVKDLSLTTEQIQLLAKEPLCTIASHTVSHPRLGDLSVDKQRNEMVESKRRLELITNANIDHFSYPFGHHNAESILLAKECGYKTATFAWGGHTRKGQTAWSLTRDVLKE